MQTLTVVWRGRCATAAAGDTLGQQRFERWLVKAVQSVQRRRQLQQTICPGMLQGFGRLFVDALFYYFPFFTCCRVVAPQAHLTHGNCVAPVRGTHEQAHRQTEHACGHRQSGQSLSCIPRKMRVQNTLNTNASRLLHVACCRQLIALQRQCCLLLAPYLYIKSGLTKAS